MLSVKKLILLMVAFVATMTPIVLHAAYVSTGRDTDVNPDTLDEIPVVDFDEGGYALLMQNSTYEFYWQEQRDVLAVFDKRNGYTWKTGLDIDPNVTKATQATACKGALRDYKDGDISFGEFQDECDASINSLTGTTTGPLQANSLIYFNYYSKGESDSIFSQSTVYSSYLKSSLYKVTSKIAKVNNDSSHWRFTVSAINLGVNKDLDLEIIADIYLSDEGFKLEILNENLTGTALPYLSNIGIANYMGAVGGVNAVYTAIDAIGEEDADYTVVDVQEEMIGGYAFVPDGTGALIRFRDNSVSLRSFKATIYGDDASQSYQNYLTTSGAYVPFKTASIPVYGIAHGNNQAAFVAYATSGSEYMSIISVPEENIYKYNSTHVNFNYNFSYNKLYTLDGDNPVPSIWEDINHFDIVMNYNFLAGDGSTDGYPANYVGMALKYKDYLIEQEELKLQNSVMDNIGIRLDFLMADSENSIVGYNTMVATTAKDVVNILKDVSSKGIENISSGMLGWQKDGLTLGNPSKTEFASKIGSKAAYRNAIEEMKELGIDLSFYQDYYLINEEQISLYRNATKHPAGWYGRVLTYNEMIYEFYYARPLKSVEWLHKQSKTFLKMGADSLTVSGMTSNLITDYTAEGTTRTQAIELYREAFASYDDTAILNLTKPNSYLYKYTDRYLQMDVYTTQFLIETDTVPFLQILLQNTMEMYAIYANFSFYTTHDVLRMIDFNLYPSFILTQQPSYVLTDTNSSIYYSTEYALYEELIEEIYFSVNGALKEVIGATWINREVLASGLIRNTYSNGVEILINYGDSTEMVGTTQVPASSYVVLGGE